MARVVDFYKNNTSFEVYGARLTSPGSQYIPVYVLYRCLRVNVSGVGIFLELILFVCESWGKKSRKGK